MATEREVTDEELVGAAIQLIKYYRDHEELTRPQVASVLGFSVGQIASLCYNNNLDWPRHEARPLRQCQFPLWDRQTRTFRICGLSAVGGICTPHIKRRKAIFSTLIV
jgi:hypothetical protein